MDAFGARPAAEEATTITFGDRSESHARMKMQGTLAASGIAIDDLHRIEADCAAMGMETEWVDLTAAAERKDVEEAAVLILRNGINVLLGREDGADALTAEHDALVKDTTALMYGREVNKHARHCLCFGAEHIEPDIKNGQGTVYGWKEVVLTSALRDAIHALLKRPDIDLQAEGNYYYDVAKCGIGFHGDAERRVVIAGRLGKSIPLVFRWFHQNSPIGTEVRLDLRNGDMYIMSDKAVGFDWRRRIIPTLRHAAGCEKFLTVKKPRGKKRRLPEGPV